MESHTFKTHTWKPCRKAVYE